MHGSYLVEPRIVTDVLEGDPVWGVRSAALLDAHRKDRLLIAPCSYLGLAEQFGGDMERQDYFLMNLGLAFLDKPSLQLKQTLYASYKRYPEPAGLFGTGHLFYIGYFAVTKNLDGILTRCGDFFRTYFPNVPVLEP
ncbi:MAG: hypothetical protein J5985_00910 [Kiritimatiellae bacterium]|nr:hypothetical protein [Kiritimatiellia bacterium]